MTIDEILAQVYNEQGFLVMGGYYSCEIGTIHRTTVGSLGCYPMRCIDLSTYEEFVNQVIRMNELDIENKVDCKAIEGIYYYRVEPTD